MKPQGTEEAPWLEPDPAVIFEADIAQDDLGMWVACGPGYEQCMGANYSAWMAYCSRGWTCPACDRAAKAEYEDWLWCARYS